jgi:16S rRNA (cytosine1402-N4)-methyltransferase
VRHFYGDIVQEVRCRHFFGVLIPFPPGFFLSAALTVHIAVLLDEVLEALNIQTGHVIVDGTLGGGGHTIAFLERVGSTGRVIALDRDPTAVAETTARVDDKRLTAVAANYADLPEVLQQLEIESVNGILLDLGLSSDQLADQNRGFSYQSEGPLDLRFNPEVGESASRLINRLGEKHLADLIYEFGEERFSRRIARKIVERRRTEKIQTADQLARLVRSCVPRSKNHSIDPATRTFQALRIAVNDELKWLSVALRRLPALLEPGSRLAVISFHSLEDRIVKQSFLGNERLKIITKKPLVAAEAERFSNPRSRSAKLRVAERR